MSSPLTPPNAGLPTGPITATEVLNRTMQLIRAHFKLVLQLALLPLAGIVLCEIPYLISVFSIRNPFPPGPPAPPNGGQVAMLLISLLILMVGISLIYGLFESAATWAMLRLDAGGPATARKAWQASWQHASRYIGLMLLRYLVLLMPVGVLFVLAILLFGITAAVAGGPHTGAAFLVAPVGVLLLLASVAYSVMVVLCLGFAFPASMAENLPPWQAFQRSLRLTRGARGRIFLALLLVYLIATAAILAVEMVVVLIAAIGAVLMSALHLNAVLEAIAAAGLAVLALPAFLMAVSAMMVSFPATLAILYRDQRRLEQLTLQPAAEAGEAASESTTETSSVTGPGSSTGAPAQ